MDTSDYDAHYDKTGENPGGDPADVVAGWGRGLHCSGDCGRWYCKEGKSEILVQTLNSADASSPPSLSTPTVQTAGTHHIEAPMIDPQARWGREEPSLHEALTANGGARFPTQPLSPAVTSETVT